MRKSVVLALVLVFALAGSSLAATLTWEGSYEAKAEWDSGYGEEANFTGPYSPVGDGLELSFTISDDKGVWDASFELDGGLYEGALGEYTVKVNEDAFQVTVWGNYDEDEGIGDAGDALDFIIVSGENEDPRGKMRVTTDALGFDLLTQLEGTNLFVNAETELEGITLGATLDHLFAFAPNGVTVWESANRFSVYGGADFDGIKVDGAFAMLSGEDMPEDDTSAFGVKASADVTDQINVNGSFRSVGENFLADDAKSGFDVGAKFTEGVLQATAKYEVATHEDPVEDDTKITIGATYRGSEDNEPFADLFKGNKYYNNVDFAFGGTYTMNDAPGAAASIIELKATGPVVPDQFWINANVKLSSNEDGFNVSTGQPMPADWSVAETAEGATEVTVDGYAKVGEKLVLKPSVSSKQWTAIDAEFVDEDDNLLVGAGDISSMTVKLNVDYNVTDDATLTAGIGQTSYSGTDDFDGELLKRFSSVGLKVKF